MYIHKYIHTQNMYIHMYIYACIMYIYACTYTLNVHMCTQK